MVIEQSTIQKAPKRVELSFAVHLLFKLFIFNPNPNRKNKINSWRLNLSLIFQLNFNDPHKENNQKPPQSKVEISISKQLCDHFWH